MVGTQNDRSVVPMDRPMFQNHSLSSERRCGCFSEELWTRFACIPGGRLPSSLQFSFLSNFSQIPQIGEKFERSTEKRNLWSRWAGKSFSIILYHSKDITNASATTCAVLKRDPRLLSPHTVSIAYPTIPGKYSRTIIGFLKNYQKSA